MGANQEQAEKEEHTPCASRYSRSHIMLRTPANQESSSLEAREVDNERPSHSSYHCGPLSEFGPLSARDSRQNSRFHQNPTPMTGCIVHCVHMLHVSRCIEADLQIALYRSTNPVPGADGHNIFLGTFPRTCGFRCEMSFSTRDGLRLGVSICPNEMIWCTYFARRPGPMGAGALLGPSRGRSGGVLADLVGPAGSLSLISSSSAIVGSSSDLSSAAAAA